MDKDCKQLYPRVSEEDCINILEMLAGKEEGFIAIYNRYEQPIRAYLRSLYFPNDILCSFETIHIDTFMKFRRTLPQYRGEENVKNRLRRIAYGLYADCMRKTGKIDFPNESIIIEEEDTNHSTIIDRILCMQDCLDQSLKSSHNKNKCVKGLILSALGWATKEIAEILKIKTANAARVFLTSCRKKLTNKSQLRDCLEDCKDKVAHQENL